MKGKDKTIHRIIRLASESENENENNANDPLPPDTSRMTRDEKNEHNKASKK